MKQIQPLDIWSDGVTKTAVCITLYISYDDLETKAVLQYALCDVDNVPIYQGSVTIAGQEYIDWGSTQDSNLEAYTIAAAQLNLILL